MKIITGFMAPTAGIAYVGGVDVFENPIAVKRKIGYLPETPPVYGDMYVGDYLSYVAALKGVPKVEIQQKVKRALEKTNLMEVRGRLIQNLSKGFRQRVGIAQAIVSEPEVLILDEPTVGLDPKQVAEIRDLIRELRGQHTIILSTHVLPEVQATCERIIIINKGKIVAEDTIENLSTRGAGESLKVALRLRTSSVDPRSVLAAVPGVRRVEAGNLPGEFQIETANDEGLVEAIAAVVIQQKWGLLEVRSVKQNLEDVFLSLTYGQNLAGSGVKNSANQSTATSL